MHRSVRPVIGPAPGSCPQHNLGPNHLYLLKFGWIGSETFEALCCAIFDCRPTRGQPWVCPLRSLFGEEGSGRGSILLLHRLVPGIEDALPRLARVLFGN